jgi:hypothetical protein
MDERDGRLRHEGMWSSAAGAAEIQLIARASSDGRRNHHWHRRRDDAYAVDGQHALQRESARPAGVRPGLFCYGDSRAHRPFSCPRGGPHASIPFKLYERECFGHKKNRVRTNKILGRRRLQHDECPTGGSGVPRGDFSRDPRLV